MYTSDVLGGIVHDVSMGAVEARTVEHIVPDCGQYSHYYQPDTRPRTNNNTTQSITNKNFSLTGFGLDSLLWLFTQIF